LYKFWPYFHKTFFSSCLTVGPNKLERLYLAGLFSLV
jgi:hypothetical protein